MLRASHRTVRTIIVLVFLLVGQLTPVANAAPAAPVDDPPREVVVRLRRDAQRTGAANVLHQQLEAAGARISQVLGNDSYRVAVPPDMDAQALATQLAATPGVAYAEPNQLRELLRTPSDTFVSKQWALAAIHAFDAWDQTTGDPLTIAILDTGVSPTHLDLKRKLLPGYDFVDNDSDPRDDEGHGTHMAGVAAADTDNAQGIAGVCWACKILPVKVLSGRGRGDDATIALGIRFAVDNGAKIISMSLGGPRDTVTLREAVEYATAHGVLIVAAVGNSQLRDNLPSYPAAYPSVLAVAATNPDGHAADFSTSGDFVKIAAPGVGVYSTLWVRLKGDTYGDIDGTSPAAPLVAGAAALLLSVRPELTPEQVAEVLEASADDIAPAGRDRATGYGLLNASRALQIAHDRDLLRRSAIAVTILGAQAAQVKVVLNDGREAQPGADGVFRFAALAPGDYTVTVHGPDGAVRGQPAHVSGTALSIAALSFDFRTPANAFQPVGPSPDATYFPQTGHTLRGAFQRYWERNGGLPIFGYPISEEFTERSSDGRDYTVQYFERHRLELHPENAPPYDVLLTRSGDLVLQQSGRSWFSFPPGVPQAGCLYFETTGHSLCEPFLSYWRTHGLELDGRPGKTYAESLALFGQPISEPQLETLDDGAQHIVQWFERARFEQHGSDSVLLGLLGKDIARQASATR